MKSPLLNQVIGIYLIAVAVVIAVQFAVEFTYKSSLEVWFWLDWFSLLGFILCVVVNLQYIRAELNSEVWARLASNVAFYASVGLTLAFIHNFVGNLFGDKDDLLFWKLINVPQVLLFASTGYRLAKT